jgi:ferredoxin-nitrite reductase
VPLALAAIAACGLIAEATSIRAGLVACTGATGCKFAAAHTKEDALAIAEHVDARLAEAGLALDAPVNIHLTGCHHSCAQHYIGDIGLIGAKVPVGEEGDTVAGYNILIGGGFGTEGAMAREFLSNLKAEDAPEAVETILKAYLAHRTGPEESFHAFAGRHDMPALAAMIAGPST